MRALGFVLFLILFASSLASCGHKGPLIQPEPEGVSTANFADTEPEAQEN